MCIGGCAQKSEQPPDTSTLPDTDKDTAPSTCLPSDTLTHADSQIITRTHARAQCVYLCHTHQQHMRMSTVTWLWNTGTHTHVTTSMEDVDVFRYTHTPQSQPPTANYTLAAQRSHVHRHKPGHSHAFVNVPTCAQPCAPALGPEQLLWWKRQSIKCD